MAGYLKHGAIGCFLTGGLRNSIPWFQMNDANDAACYAVPDAWYLATMAVHADYEGQGIGSELIRSTVIPYVRSHEAKIFNLVTNSPRNTVFYERLGFKCFHHREFEFRGKTLGAWSYEMRFVEK